MKVDTFIRQEVQNQGFDLSTDEGKLRVEWMKEAWAFAQEGHRSLPLTFYDVESLGRLVEQERNYKGLRYYNGAEVQVGGRRCPDARDTICLMDFWVSHVSTNAQPLEAYLIFQLIHPFVDGNGRVGKILLCWLNGTLDDPEFPPDLFGGEVP